MEKMSFTSVHVGETRLLEGGLEEGWTVPLMVGKGVIEGWVRLEARRLYASTNRFDSSLGVKEERFRLLRAPLRGTFKGPLRGPFRGALRGPLRGALRGFMRTLLSAPCPLALVKMPLEAI